MPIDPRIALGVQQSTFDPAAAMQNALALRNAQQTGQLNQLKLQQEQQAMQEAAGLQNYLASANLSTPEGMSGLLKYGTPGATVAKTIAERQKTLQEIETSKATEKKTLGEYSLKKVDAYKDMLNFVRNPQDYAKWVQMQRNDPDLVGTPVHDISDEDLQRNLAMIPTDQAGFDAFKGKAWMGIDKWTTSQQEQARIKETERAHREDEKIAWAREDREAETQRLAKDPTFQASLAEAKKRGELIAQGDVTAMQTLPGTIQKAESAINIIDQMIGKRIPETDAKGNIVKNPDGSTKYLPDTPENSKQYSKNRHVGFETAVGAGLPFASKIPGTNAANFTAMHDQVTSQAFLQAYETLRGTGSIATKEGEKATAAITRMNRSQSEDEYVKAAREFQDAVEKMVANARTKASTAQSKPYGTQTKVSGKGTKDDPIKLD